MDFPELTFGFGVEFGFFETDSGFSKLSLSFSRLILDVSESIKGFSVLIWSEVLDFG